MTFRDHTVPARLVPFALGAFTVAGALLAIVALRSEMQATAGLPPWVWSGILAAGLAIAAVAVVAFVLLLFARPAKWIGQQFTVAIGDAVHEFVPAKERDLPELQSFYSRFFGADVPELALMMQWQSRSKAIFWLVYEVRRQAAVESRKLVGSFKIVPVTKSGVQELDAETVSGSTFRPSHVAARRRDVAAYYVGDVAATDRAARAAVVAYLRSVLGADEFAGYALYARPLTPDGQRLMRTLGFVRVADGREPVVPDICRLAARRSAAQRQRRVSRYKLIASTSADAGAAE